MPFDFTLSSGRRAWIRQLLGPIDAAKWSELSWELFAWQYPRVPAYQRLCLGRQAYPQDFKSWRDVPAVPQQLFKREKLYCGDLPSPKALYETSGTTTGEPGRQYLFSTDIYRAVSVEGARRAGFFAGAPKLHFLVPSPLETPHSSLSAMFGFWQKAARQAESRFWVRHGQFEFSSLRETLERHVRAHQPVALCGTAFSFVHLLDAWAGLPPLRLPRGSRLLETGGFKGRSREVSKPELYSQLSRLFTLSDEHIWNEYGMSELSSQAYARGTNGLHFTPPWARVIICDPTTGREVRLGQRGLVRWLDLANTDSVFALQTLDLAERTPEGFKLIGRMARTEPRGCSLGTDDLAFASKRR